MKVAPKILFLFRDPEGFSAAIADAIFPNPNSSLRRLEEHFELSLEHYGVKDRKACGDFFHFVDDKGVYQVSLLLLEKYETPVLVCAMNEVLVQIVAETSTLLPTLVVPFILASSKLKFENITLANGSDVKLYGVQIGPETDSSQIIGTRTQKAPSSLQIHYEPLACFLQLVRVLKFQTSVIIGQRHGSSDKSIGKELEVLYEIGEIVADTTSLCFLRDMVTWNPAKKLKDGEEPWRALYG
ncbi:hypothetical protein HS088_TW06G00357 [Tripterygium wilfordii]|uniref:DUF7894 domain-containing protein n=1 Tax=Tripterygium wilfordii TaxID=458696 RepID=A0A7J7DIJ9_TRIWF|nr:uncharacterized protein LOC119999931 [Tripterygium wilfordii]KAF5746190.1 hypothetical protein HS088_TW06G00357 [Tripterygium wilfordii]